MQGSADIAAVTESLSQCKAAGKLGCCCHAAELQSYAGADLHMLLNVCKSITTAAMHLIAFWPALLQVDSHLRVVGSASANIFAVGDCNDVPETKLGFLAREQAKVRPCMICCSSRHLEGQ